MARLADYFIVVGYDHEKPGEGEEEIASSGPGAAQLGQLGRVLVPRPSLWRGLGTRGSAPVPAGLGQDRRAGRAGANCAKFLWDKLLPSILSE
ncbi:hypothetical protein J1605_014236 [Eschrichtius robustus]|uniref:Uncharacterized protein n=1 Tax=Eschrichtius robustus TaxID=9764 RepID=A0AB34GDZ3_ESCRO|nr:hypothetical protein J1605_014236 [Eschrichtius robustus]